MKLKFLTGFLFVVFGLLSSGNLCGQNIRSKTWLKKNDRGNRYEGTYEKDIGSPFFEVISLWGYFERFTIDQRQNYTLKFYTPDSGYYRVHAEELLTRSWYWMQTKDSVWQKGWQTFGPWPVDGLLRRLRIPSNNLGVLIESERPGSNKLIPALVYHSNGPSALKRYVLIIRLGKSISRGSFKVFKATSDEEPLLVKAIYEMDGGMHLPLVISATVLGDSSQWLRVKVSLTERGTPKTREYDFQFYHHKSL